MTVHIVLDLNSIEPPPGVPAEEWAELRRLNELADAGVTSEHIDLDWDDVADLPPAVDPKDADEDEAAGVPPIDPRSE